MQKRLWCVSFLIGTMMLGCSDSSKSQSSSTDGSQKEDLQKQKRLLTPSGEEKEAEKELKAIEVEVEQAKVKSDLEVKRALESLDQNSTSTNDAKSVSDADYVHAPSFSRYPEAPKEPTVAKMPAKVRVARATADAKIAELDARATLAWIHADLEKKQRIYGKQSLEYNRTQKRAKERIAMLLGNVEMVKSKALGDISQAVRDDEIIKENLGIVSDQVSKGQRNYLKYFKKPCGFDGAKFAQKHTQEEWDRLRRSGKLAKEATKICPDLSFKEEWTLPLYAFCYMYAKESGNIPSCPDH